MNVCLVTTTATTTTIVLMSSKATDVFATMAMMGMAITAVSSSSTNCYQLLSCFICVIYLLFIHHVLYFAFFPACKDGDNRLVNGSSHREGRVEVCRDNVYGTICDNGWGLLDAQVICRSLNFSDAGIYS